MEEKEAIRQLQEELQQLQQRLEAQQRQVQELQQRIHALSGDMAADMAAAPKPVAKPPNQTLENFIGLRLIHLVGIIVLVIGLSIGVKYAFDKRLISEAARIVLAYAAGVTLFLLSLKLKRKYTLFSGILFSGAMASLYFTTYGAFVYYGMLSFATAFAIMMALTVYTIVQAIGYNSKEVALLGLVGAYGIPFLISRNADRADLFFLYILLINTGVVYVSLKKDWKSVGRAAQLLTSLLFLGWAAMRYTPKDQGTGIAFMLLFFLLFSVLILAPKFYKPALLSPQAAVQQWVNNVFLYLAALLILAPGMAEKQLAAITGVTALFVAVQTWACHAFWPKEAYLRKLHFVLAFALVILFVALEWNGLKVTLLWLLMALLVFSWGVWYKSVALRMAGISLMGLTLLKLLVLDSATFTTVQKVISYLVLGILLLIVSFFYQKFKQKLFDDI